MRVTDRQIVIVLPLLLAARRQTPARELDDLVDVMVTAARRRGLSELLHRLEQEERAQKGRALADPPDVPPGAPEL